jgi:hypothetical protein
MAKITEHREDRIGSLLLNSAALSLITMFSITAQVRHTYYFVWAAVVSYFWGIATYERTPRLYKNAKTAGVIYLLFGGALSATIAFITMVFRDPARFAEYLIQFP